MSTRIGQFIRSNVLGLIAIFIALGGTAFAVSANTAPRNSVGPRAIKNGAVRNSKLGADAVSGDKVADGTLTGADIAANSLTGQQIDESTLTGVDAATLSGLGPDAFLSASAAAGGDLTGTYPNPTIAPGAVTSGAIANGTITSSDIDTSQVQTRLSGVPCSSGQAITNVGASGAATCGTTAPSGSAGGDLAGSSYPNPTIATGAVNSAKIADNSVGSADINNAQVQQRVSGSCTTGQTITAVNANGTVTCGHPLTGVVQPNGTTFWGSGFTPTRNGTGDYTVTVPTGTFGTSNLPPLLTPIFSDTVADISSYNAASGGVTLGVQFHDRATGTLTDTWFSFLIMPS